MTGPADRAGGPARMPPHGSSRPRCWPRRHGSHPGRPRGPRGAAGRPTRARPAGRPGRPAAACRCRAPRPTTRWLGDLTAAVNKELRGPALAGAHRRATREEVQDARQRQAEWQQRDNMQAQAARIAAMLISGGPAALPGGAIGAEIELAWN